MLFYVINWDTLVSVDPTSGEVESMSMIYTYYHNKTFIYVGFWCSLLYKKPSYIFYKP